MAFFASRRRLFGGVLGGCGLASGAMWFGSTVLAHAAPSPAGSGDVPPVHEETDVVVIGAGISGLACAQTLRRKGVRVIVVESSHHLGGRIRTLNEHEFENFDATDDIVPRQHSGWLRVHRPESHGAGPAKAPYFGADDYNFEIGGEFIHGPQSAMNEELARQGIKSYELFTWAHGDGGPSAEPSHHGGVGMYYSGRTKDLLRHDALAPEQHQMIAALWKMNERPAAEADADRRSLKQYLRDEGVTDDALVFAENGYANTVCGTLDKISAARMAKCERNWLVDGDGDFRVSNNQTLYSLIEKLAHDVDVRLRSPASQVTFSKDGTRVTVTTGGRHPLNISASAVVVTAPIPALQRRTITFQPPLPDRVNAAISSIQTEPALKIFAKFDRAFWPANLEGTICADTFAPEVWFTCKGLEPDRDGFPCDNEGTANVGPCYATGFFTSDQARRVSLTPTSEAFDQFKSQLADMFKPAAAESEEGHKEVVESLYRGGFIIDWGQVPNIWGGYSTPTLVERPEARTALGQPLYNDRLFFAGEATDEKGFMTAHSAFETGLRAAAGAEATVSSNAK
jgi:monoamine oxidase